MISRILFVFFILLSFGFGQAQDSKIVLIEGISTNYQKARKMRIEIDFSESSDVCGPGKQFNTVYDQFYSFGEKLDELHDDNKLVFEEITNIQNLANATNKITFACEIMDTLNIGSQIAYAGKYAFADDIRFIDVLEDKNFEEEYQFAIDAFENAKKKADKLAKLLGYSSYEVAYIDDDTEPSRQNGPKQGSKKREYRVWRKFFEEKQISRYKLFVGFEFRK